MGSTYPLHHGFNCLISPTVGQEEKTLSVELGESQPMYMDKFEIGQHSFCVTGHGNVLIQGNLYTKGRGSTKNWLFVHKKYSVLFLKQGPWWLSGIIRTIRTIRT
jgi:hypothetical protein